MDEKIEHTLIMGGTTAFNSLQDINDKSIGILVQSKAIDEYSSLKEWDRQDHYSLRFRKHINSLLEVLKLHYGIQSEKVLYYPLKDNHSISHFDGQELRIWQNELPLFKWGLTQITKELAESEYWTRKATSFYNNAITNSEFLPIPEGMRVKRLPNAEQNNRYYIEYRGFRGYVNKSLLTKDSAKIGSIE